MYTLTALLLLGFGTAAFTPHAAAATPSSGTGLLIPLYSNPGATWNTVIQLKEANPSVPITVVVNPYNGPGAKWSSSYDTWIVTLREAGINVLGYVYTSYGTRSASSVESDIAAWKAMYWINGIFLDNMANVPGYQSYYSSLTAFAHSLGLGTVVGNPGCDVPVSYFGTVDVLLINEKASVPTMATLANYTAGGTKSEFALVSYAVPSLTTSEVSLMGNYASYIYITDGTMPQPYAALPSYYSALVSDLASFLSSTSDLSVQSTDMSGNPTSGISATVTSGGNLVYEGYTPFTFMGTTGAQYTVTVSNHQSEVFSHWQDGTTGASKTVTLSQATALTASFATVYTLTVSSVTSSGAALTGLRTIVYVQGTQVAKGFTPMVYLGSPGVAYQACVQNYQSDVFSHWSNGSTSSCITVTLNQNVQLTAVYNT
ncbi:MAG: spherulation-specific family 4 protein [Nitrososphaerales archaeon]|jgi:hypothetical protein